MSNKIEIRFRRCKTPLNYNYYGFGEKKIAPTAIWDDSRFTYLRYADNRDLPMIYKLNP
ncbi:MAG: TrbG/VirB9 family P-type conjugative transfer protein, partial [Neisseriaceae bacterium]|nr:TrbG/VirB9 family P-type conjugative transfer protein [Neisseriaceae bacterium]